MLMKSITVRVRYEKSINFKFLPIVFTQMTRFQVKTIPDSHPAKISRLRYGYGFAPLSPKLCCLQLFTFGDPCVLGDPERAERGEHQQTRDLRAGGQEWGRAHDALHGHPGRRQEVRLELWPQRALQVPDRRGSGHQGLGGGSPRHVHWWVKKQKQKTRRQQHWILVVVKLKSLKASSNVSCNPKNYL